MRELFVEKSIDVNAPASKVWDVLTKPKYTDKWALEFSNVGTEFHVESDWKLGSPVLWKNKDGSVFVEGNVTAVEPDRLLRYTVSDVRHEKALVSDDNGITCDLAEHGGTTTLRIVQGDFSAMDDGEKYCRMSADTWDRVLPIVKELAETWP